MLKVKCYVVVQNLQSLWNEKYPLENANSLSQLRNGISEPNRHLSHIPYRPLAKWHFWELALERPRSKKYLGQFFEFRRKNGLQKSFLRFKKIEKFWIHFPNSEANGDRVNFYRGRGHALFTFWKALRTQSTMVWTRHLSKNLNDATSWSRH